MIKPPEGYLVMMLNGGERLADEATRLSEFVESVDTRMASLPGHVEASIEIDNFHFGYGRVEGEWHLYCKYFGPLQLRKKLTACCIESKVAAVAKLEKLLQTIANKQRELANQIQDMLPIVGEAAQCQ